MTSQADSSRATMNWIVIGVLLGAAVAAIVLLVVLRSRSGVSVQADESAEAVSADANVEYEWTVGEPLMKALLIILLISGIVGVFLLLSKEDPDFSIFMQLLAAGFGVLIAILGGLLRRKTYQITTDGLYTLSRGSKDHVMVFAWSNLRWIRPNDNGFRYYQGIENTSDLLSGVTNLAAGNYIYCGKHAALVNSLIMARGIPTSPPQD